MIKVVLKQDVEHLGQKGEIKTVKDGYARNYLFPRGLAVISTPAMEEQVQKQIEAQERKTEKRREDLKQRVAELKNTVVKVYMKVGEKGQLFGSVTGSQVADALREQADLEVDKSAIEFSDPIRAMGLFEVGIKLGEGTDTSCKVSVLNEEELKTEKRKKNKKAKKKAKKEE